MKKYKLIKKYPGSPKLGEIIVESKASVVQGYFINTYSIEDHDSANFQLKNPEDYPEFWEEVIEKDYEILSYIGNKSKNIFYLNPPNGKIKYNILNKELMNNNKYYDIHSIKRLSDNEKFNIGDNLETGTIQSIHICNIYNTITFGVSKDDEDTWLEDAKKVKEPLFTTEDGVEIFEGGKCFSVDLDTFKLEIEYNPCKNQDFDYWKYFSTKKAAEEYVILNKPCLNINDLLEIKRIKGCLGDTLIHHAKELVQSRIF